MGEIKSRQPVKLIIGFIYKNKLSFDKARRLLTRRFGRIDFESDPVPFCCTDYYEQEFGQDLKRSFISFKKLIPPERLSAIKLLTNKIEKILSYESRRQVNIDPGYIELSKLILASTKEHYHRIYLNNGIYAEITLYYRDGTFRAWEWTYRDYKTEEYIEAFNNIRHIYSNQIQAV